MHEHLLRGGRSLRRIYAHRDLYIRHDPGDDSGYEHEQASAGWLVISPHRRSARVDAQSAGRFCDGHHLVPAFYALSHERQLLRQPEYYDFEWGRHETLLLRSG